MLPRTLAFLAKAAQGLWVWLQSFGDAQLRSQPPVTVWNPQASSSRLRLRCMARDTYSLSPAVSHFARAVRAANNTRRSTSFNIVDHVLTIMLSKFLRARRSFAQSRGSLSLQFYAV